MTGNDIIHYAKGLKTALNQLIASLKRLARSDKDLSHG